MRRKVLYLLTLFIFLISLTSCDIQIGDIFGSNSSDELTPSIDSTEEPTNSQDVEPTIEPSSTTPSIAETPTPTPTPTIEVTPTPTPTPYIEEDGEELLKNNSFDSLNSWTIYNDGNVSQKVVSNGNGVLKLEINNKNSAQNWSVQCLQNGIILENGKEYELSFEITSSYTRSIQFLIQQDTSYSPIPFNKTYSLNANEPLIVKEKFIVDQTSTYLYGFMLGNVNGTLNDNHIITIKNPSLLGDKLEIESQEGLDGTYDAATTSKNGKTLVWNDEFNSTTLDETKWTHQIGNGSGGWGNNELQYYTSSTSNSYVSNGSLKIVARKESMNSYNYTSARIITKDKYEFKYGYIEARMALPSMNGIWPAFWMLGADIDENPWPFSGEIDIMEAINYNNEIYSTIHWNQGSSYSHAYTGTSAINVGNRCEYHTYALDWTSTKLTFYVDGTEIYSVDISTNSSMSCFNNEFYILFNVAVGGNWPGFNIGDSFPQAMSVDYIRVYQ
ncbi:MAG: family 16 glycosylhydrolase [Acholeplasmatales bacterium]|nr:family 16 glycosylhydrolase [Acholeplasmatales bacterium]